jgi:purine-nucleoside phosphorylase
MEELSKIIEASNYIKSKIGEIPDTAIILGSGLGPLANEVNNEVFINYKDIPFFPISTVVGHEGRFVYGDIDGKKVIMMQGRFHFYEGYDMNKVTMPVLVLKHLGIKNLIVTNAAGGVNKNFKPGNLMIINDHINHAGTNPLIGKNIEEFGPRFPDMSSAYNKEFIKLAQEAAVKNNINVVNGVYIMFTGPSYETPAEIRMARTLGGDAVGMSTVPEVIIANYCGLSVLGISCITNMAAGILDQPLSHLEVIETSNKVSNEFKVLVKSILSMI